MKFQNPKCSSSQKGCVEGDRAFWERICIRYQIGIYLSQCCLQELVLEQY